MSDSPLLFLSGDGEMSNRIRQYDWGNTPIGTPDSWPTALQTLVGVMLGAKQAMFIAWGPQQITLYNDAYITMLGDKHPEALGTPILDVWHEIRADLVPLVDQVYAGQPVHMDDITLMMERHGYSEETHFAFSYTPVRDETGRVCGLFCATRETTGHVLAERRLQEESQRQRRLFERAPGFIAILRGPEHIFEFTNAAYDELIGDRDILGKTVREALPELQGQTFFDWLDQVYQTGNRRASSDAPVRLQRTLGAALEERFIDFIYEPVINESGQITGVFLEGHDVTERHSIQEALRASEMQFSLLAQAMPNIVWTASEVGVLDWFNDRAYEYTGKPHDTLDSKTWASLIHHEDLNRTTARWHASMASGKAFDAEIRLKRWDGEYRWHLTRATPVLSHSGQLMRWVGTNIDIHDQKLAAQTLQEINQTLERRIEERTMERDRVWRHSRDLLVVTDFDGIVHAVNPAWTAILGHLPKQVEGHNFREFVWPEDIEQAHAGFAQATALDNLNNFELRLQHRDGTPRWISWQTSAEGGVLYAYGRHITAEKQQAKALRRAEEQLRQAQKMEAIGQLTGGIAHDFNNLLTGIIGSLELMQTRLAEDRTERLEHYASGAMSAAQRAASLTHRLLAFARRQPLDPKAVDICQLIENMQELLQRTLGPLYNLHVSCDERLWITHCDPYQLETAILNIAINARDAMPGGGRLQIDIRNASIDTSSMGQHDIAPGNYVTIAISDTGGGMSAQTIQRAIEPFFTTKPQGHGTGLGLSMVYGFAKQSGGHLDISSQEGKGSRLTIYLPRSKDSLDDDNDNKAAHTPASTKPATVLLVEDEAVIRELIAESLAQLGHQVLQASDGPGGLEVLQSEQHIDLLVTDIGLPGLNGQQLADKALERRPGLNVLFITGYAESTTFASGFMRAGMAMMTKPFTISALEKKIRNLLGKHRTTEQAGKPA